MEILIDPIDSQIIEKEIKNEDFLRASRLGNNELYVVTGRI